MLTFYDFGSTVTPLGVASAKAFDFTSGAFSVSDSALFAGATPQCGLFVVTNHEVANGAQSNDISISLGSTTASNRLVRTRSLNAQTASTVSRATSTTQSIYTRTSGGSDKAATGTLQADGVGFGASGVAGSHRGMAAMFDASRISNFADGTVALGSSAQTVSTNIGFRPDLVIFFGNGQNVGAGANSTMGALLGAVVDDGSNTQRSVYWVEQNAVAAGGNAKQTISTAHAIMELSTAGALSYSGIVSITATGFDTVVNASAGGDSVAYLAFKFSSATARIKDFSTPTATGSQAVTGVGCAPEWAMLAGTMLEAVDTYAGTDATKEGLGISFINAANQTAAAWRANSGADPTVTSSRLDDGVALLVSDNTGSGAIAATLTSLDSDGITLSYSAVKANAKRCWGVFVG